MDKTNPQSESNGDAAGICNRSDVRSSILIQLGAATLACAILSPMLGWGLGTIWWIVFTALCCVAWLQLGKPAASDGEALPTNKTMPRWQLSALGLCWAAVALSSSNALTDVHAVLVLLLITALTLDLMVVSSAHAALLYHFLAPALLLPCIGLLSIGDGPAAGAYAAAALIVIVLNSRYSKMLAPVLEARQFASSQLQQLRAANVELSSDNERLSTLSATDGLTQIANRRHFDHVLQREWLRARRTGAELAYIMVDIDYFKPFNDHYGHLKGDDCLKAVAHALEAELRRPGDFVGRYGGEEFAILSPDTPSDGVKVLGENIRAAVEALDIAHQSSPISSRVTVSVGATVVSPTAQHRLEDLIESADSALYQAKEQGRNQVCFKTFSVSS